MENWIVKIVDPGYKITREIFIYRRAGIGKTEVLRSGGMVETIDTGVKPEPTLELFPETLQALANALAEVGIKPQEGYLEGKLEATEKHLEDMRTLVFKKK